MSYKLTNHNIIFIHPPKCGGSSITETLKKGKYIGDRVDDGAHQSIAQMNNAEFIADEYFVTVRNPYDRFYSYYHFAIEWDKKRIRGELPLKAPSVQWLEDRVKILEEMKFDGFVNLLTDDDKRLEFTRKHLLKGAFKPQIHWFDGQTKKPVKIFKIEEGTVWKYLQKKGYEVQPNHIKKSTYKTEPYTQEQKDIVYDYFIDDFTKLGYER